MRSKTTDQFLYGMVRSSSAERRNMKILNIHQELMILDQSWPMALFGQISGKPSKNRKKP
jgi:hypothetical protein